MTVDARFLAHAIALEEDAMTRYRELAEAMQTHNNPEVAEFFRDMSRESAKHLAEVQTLAGDRAQTGLKAWDFDWEEDAPESASYEALHYRMDLRSAMKLALANERAAEAFYRQAAAEASDDDTAALAREFADEESEHAALLVAKMAALPAAPPHIREDDDPAHMPE